MKKRSGGMVKQMSNQMDITKERAGNLMSKAKKMNSKARYKKGGTVVLMSFGALAPYMGMTRRKDDDDNREEEDESLIQSTENQVRARHFNNNDGKGTF